MTYGRHSFTEHCITMGKYCRQPMGLRRSPRKMSELKAGVEFARAYLDDLLIISNEKEFEKKIY